MDQANSLRNIVRTRSARKQFQRPIPSATKSTPRVISVTSGKGGVGKTNIVGNLAMAFNRAGKKVLILDADLGLANIDIIFGLRPQYNIGHVINGEKSLAEVIVETNHGIRIIPAGSGIMHLTQLTEGQKLTLLGEFETLDQALDIVLIDTGAGISSNVIYFNLAADECIIVATLEPTSITDAYAMMKVMAGKHGTKHFKLLVNMVKSEQDAKKVYLTLSQAVEKFLNDVVIEYIGFITHDDLLRHAVLKRHTIVDLYPDAVASQQFIKLGQMILTSPVRTTASGNIKFFFQRMMDYQEDVVSEPHSMTS